MADKIVPLYKTKAGHLRQAKLAPTSLTPEIGVIFAVMTDEEIKAKSVKIKKWVPIHIYG